MTGQDLALGDEIPLRRSSRTLLRAEQVSRIFVSEAGWLGRRRVLHALQQVSLRLLKSEALGIIGPSDSGKTTLARTLLRLLPASDGRIHFAGQDITDLPERELSPLRRRMQLVFQDPSHALNPDFTLRAAVAEGLHQHRLVWDPEEERARVAECLAELGYEPPSLDRTIAHLSAGERQLVGIARALILKPDLLICDEPTSFLDAILQRTVMERLLGEKTERSASLVFISKNLDLVERYTERVAVFYLGQLIEIGPTRRVFLIPQHPYTRALLNARRIADPSRRRLQVIPEHAAPSPYDPPKGCPFHPQCPRSEPGLCDRERPKLDPIVSTDQQWRVACWHPHA